MRVIENAHLLGFALSKLGSSSNFRMPRALGSGLTGARTATARRPSAF